jgi:hypothetical protein
MDAGAIGHRHPGDIDIRTITFISKGQVWDIGTMVAEFSIYQDLSEHYLHADFVIDDAMSFLSRFTDNSTPGFTGNEVIVISYRNAGLDGFGDEQEYRNHYFSIYEMTDRVKIKEGREMYKLNGISLESYSSAPWKVSKSYGRKGSPLIHKFAESLYNEYIYTNEVQGMYEEVRKAISISIDKSSFFQETTGRSSLVIPNLTVDDTMDFFCSEADSDDHIPYFVFYENAEGFNFVNLGFLTEYDPIETYTYAVQNTAETEDPKEGNHYKILGYNVIKQSSIFDNLEEGMIRNESLNIDLLKKKTELKEVSYQDKFDKFKKLMNTRISGSAPKLSTPYLTMMTTREGHDSDPLFDAEKPTPKRLNIFSNASLAYKTSLFNTIVEVSIPANANILVGDTIDLVFPTTREFEEDELKDGKDKFLSGKYLITKVRFKMQGGTSGDDAACILECVKDGAML